MLLQQNYYLVVGCLGKLMDALCAKFGNVVNEMVRGSFTRRRVDWSGNSGKILLWNNPLYQAVLREIPGFPKFVGNCGVPKDRIIRS